MSVYHTTISKAQQLISPPSAALMYLWMLSDDSEYYTQKDIINRYGMNRRSVRNILYRLIEQGLITRKYESQLEPRYYPEVNNLNIVSQKPKHEPIAID